MERICNVGESDLSYKQLHRKTYFTDGENRKTVSGTKDISRTERVSAFMCTNADGSWRVPMVIIGKAKEPRCFSHKKVPCAYFNQANAWVDSSTFNKWWIAVFVPYLRSKNDEQVLLLMYNCVSHEELVEDRDR